MRDERARKKKVKRNLRGEGKKRTGIRVRSVVLIDEAEDTNTMKAS